MSLLAALWRAIFGRPDELIETQVSDARQRTVDVFACEQADLVRDQKVTEKQALTAIAEHFPEMTADEAAHAFARGMFLTR
ncbi:hypothetical protein NCC78_22130 [Micromonospora phytophila]|uniref:hypothetical protein n=1 Tax=Micromonospora phytophila TaxID=709888 RepID=UPI00202E167A|nr:hypothetical protein [Micromonospora phytophila]MCM0677367.1 hypothetical protein [Micromonospora phytophila]